MAITSAFQADDAGSRCTLHPNELLFLKLRMPPMENESKLCLQPQIELLSFA